MLYQKKIKKLEAENGQKEKRIKELLEIIVELNEEIESIKPNGVSIHKLPEFFRNKPTPIKIIDDLSPLVDSGREIFESIKDNPITLSKEEFAELLTKGVTRC